MPADIALGLPHLSWLPESVTPSADLQPVGEVTFQMFVPLRGPLA